MLPMGLLLKRLENEEKELSSSDVVVRFAAKDYYSGEKGKEMPVYTVYGWENVETVRTYDIEFKAQIYYKPKNGRDILPLNVGTARVYVLRWYPYYDDSRRLGAPVRLSWLTPIFHPNIAPGPLFGGNGVVCWNLLRKSMTKISLIAIINGLRVLISNPYPDDPIAIPQICKEAAEYFKKHPPPKVIRSD